MIYETVITTKNEDGTVYIAPMGIRVENDHYVIAPFKPSTTLNNLTRTNQAVINFTDDVLVFAGCLTRNRDWPITSANVVDGAVLKAALSHCEVEVVRKEEDELRPVFYCKSLHSETHAPFKGFNRAQAAVVEASILVSRLTMLPSDKIDNEIEYLKIAIDKTAGEKEKKAWGWLMQRIDEYRKEQQSEVLHP